MTRHSSSVCCCVAHPEHCASILDRVHSSPCQYFPHPCRPLSFPALPWQRACLPLSLSLAPKIHSALLHSWHAWPPCVLFGWLPWQYILLGWVLNGSQPNPQPLHEPCKWCIVYYANGIGLRWGNMAPSCKNLVTISFLYCAIDMHVHEQTQDWSITWAIYMEEIYQFIAKLAFGRNCSNQSRPSLLVWCVNCTLPFAKIINEHLR